MTFQINITDSRKSKYVSTIVLFYYQAFISQKNWFSPSQDFFTKTPWLWPEESEFKIQRNALFILLVKFMQNRQNKQRHFHSTGKIACRLSQLIIVWNIHMVCSQNQNILSGLIAQWVYSESTTHTTKYCNIFKKEVHVAANFNLCTVKFYLL